MKDMHFSTYIMEIKNIYKHELAKYMHQVCNQMLPKEITEEYECTPNYITVFTRDN